VLALGSDVERLQSAKSEFLTSNFRTSRHAMQKKPNDCDSLLLESDIIG